MGDADLLHRVGVGGHVGQQHEHALVLLDRELLGDRQRHVRHEQALDDRVGGLVDEHHRAVEDAVLLERGPEEVVVVEDQTHAAEDHDVGVGLEADARQQLRCTARRRPRRSGSSGSRPGS